MWYNWLALLLLDPFSDVLFEFVSMQDTCAVACAPCTTVAESGEETMGFEHHVVFVFVFADFLASVAGRSAVCRLRRGAPPCLHTHTLSLSHSLSHLLSRLSHLFFDGVSL